MRGGLGARVPGAVITVGLLGHGLTGAWPRREYTIETYADFIEMLADALKLERFALIGHSLAVWPGRRGNAAGSCEPAHPVRLRGLSTRRWLVAMADAAGTPAAGRRYRHPFHSPVVGARAAEPFLCRSGDGDGRECAAHRRVATLSRQPRGHPAARPHPAAAPSGAAQAVRCVDRDPVGGKDRWLPVADAFHFQNDIKGAGLEIFEKFGHNLMDEDAEATAAAVAAFLQPNSVHPAPRREPTDTDPAVHSSALPKRTRRELKPSDAAFPTLARAGRPIGNKTRTSNYIVGNAGPVGAAPCTAGKPRSIPSAASIPERTTGGR